jgi:TonB-linked SusC/RagA family outer membrane protein
MKSKLRLALLPGGSRLFLVLISLFLSAFSIGQTVTGTVMDGNAPVIGATVTVQGTSRATTTNSEGRFEITASGNDVLVISSVGYRTQEIALGGRSSFSVTLVTETQNLNEVVVTALGITKEARGLGYSATNVKPDQLTVNRTPNVINALQGKVAGVNISSLGTGPGGTSKIRIRGQSSIGGGSSPLIVINGVPVDNTNFNSGTTAGNGVYADGGDGLSSINPDDIENMTILKGAPAAALYGSRAKDGVIMITTRTKGRGRGLGVSYNLNYTNETPLDFTEYQKLYGQGEGGIRPTTANPTSGQWSFGELIQPGMTHALFSNLNVPYVAQGSRIKEFYRNGQNLVNTVTLESSGDKGGLHLSLTNSNNKGIVPNNSFDRKGMNLGFNYNLSEKLSLTGSINYTREINKNPPNIANQDNSMPTALMALANTMPLSVLDANKYNAQGNEYQYSRFTNRTNPFWTLAEQFHNIKRDRIFGNVAVKYDLLSWLSVQGRFGQDYWSRDEDVNNFPTGHASRAAADPGFVNGIYTQESRRFRETNLDFLVTANKEFGDFEATLTAGGNQMRRRLDVNNVQVTDFVIRGLYTVQNGRAKNPVYNFANIGVNSLYSSGEVSWKRTLYLSGTVRNDWFSTLSPANRSILYPSVTAAYVLSETLDNIPWLDFAKLRVGYAQVGSDNDVGFAADKLYYNVNGNLAKNPLGVSVAVGSISGFVIPNPDLKPSRVAETEVGVELRMFKSRVNIDLAAYRKITSDQIISAQVSDAAGFTSTFINSGKSRNIGFEALLNLVPIRTTNFSWEFTANTGYNKTKVLSILTDKPGERITVGTHPFNGEVRQIVGQEMGQIAGFGYLRNAKGEMVYQTNGVPQRTAEFILFGSALPKWTGGFLNTFNYKGISLAVFIDYKLGGKVLSGTNFNAVRHGLHKMTLLGRTGGVTGVGVNPSGGQNTAVTPVQTYWEHPRTMGIVEPIIYKDGYWKLRQITAGYDFTKFIPAKWPIKGLKLDLVASNVLIIKKWIDNIDPESFGYGADNMVGLESPGVPTTRGLGLNLNIKF